MPNVSCKASFTLTNRGTYGGDVIGLQVEDDFLYSLDAFFCGEVHLVVLAADEGGNLKNAKTTDLKTKQVFLFLPQLIYINCIKKLRNSKEN